MRVVTALGLCESQEPEIYRPNHRTATLTLPIGRDGIRCMYVQLHISPPPRSGFTAGYFILYLTCKLTHDIDTI